MSVRISQYHIFHARSNPNLNPNPNPNLACNLSCKLNPNSSALASSSSSSSSSSPPAPPSSSSPCSSSGSSSSLKFLVRASSLGTTAETSKASSKLWKGKASKSSLIEEQKQQYLRQGTGGEEREEEEKDKEEHTFLTSDTALIDVICPPTYSYKETFVIRCYEVGMNRTASIETMANLLQEVACNHAQSVGFSTDGFATTPSMRKRRLIWVTTRMHIEMDHYPVWGDELQVETWCQGEGKAGIRRDWLLTDVATNLIIGRATSTWVMMNQDSRRLSRITDDIRMEYEQYCPIAPRYAFPEENSSSLKKIPKLQDPPQYIRSGLMPRRGDLDMNQHVNNVTYIGWVLESIPPEILDTHQLHRITLDYRRECKHSDVVDSLATAESQCDGEHNDKQAVQNQANRVAVNGMAVDGIAVNGMAVGVPVNGAAVNGTAVNRTEVNGTAVDRALVNGAAVDGMVINGMAVNGAAVDAMIVNGSSNVSALQDLEFLHLVRLATSEVEINRGRTVWKAKS